jgi:drug/metabolite transporter (DMT)-like permease
MTGPGVLFGLAAAAAFGAGDFFGGRAVHRASALVVAAGSQLVGGIALIVLLLVIRPGAPDIGAVLLGLLAGLTGGIGVAALYRGLSMGSMGLVAAISGIGSVLIPLVADVLIFRSSLNAWQMVGVVLAAAAGAAAGGAVRQGVSVRAVALATLAAISFGAWFILLDLAASHDQSWALLSSRVAGTTLLTGLAVASSFASSRTGAWRSVRAVWPLIVCSGLLDVGGNGLFVLSSAQISVGLAAALSGVYPLVTMVLARIFLRERLPPLGLAGLGLALAAIVLISLGQR